MLPMPSTLSLPSSIATPVGPPRAAPTPPPAAGAPERCANAITGLSIVLPCFDEAANIAVAVEAAVAAGSRCATDYEVIVVDDGSADDSAAIVAGIATGNPRVRLVAHARNRGYGDAVRTGIGAATLDWVFLTDADLQFDLRELEELLPATVRADLVVGWRILRQDPVHRRMNATAWNWLVRHVFGLPVRDVDCAFKLMRRDLVQGCALTSGGAMISTELLVRALASGARLEEIGVHHRPRTAGESSGANPHVVAKAFRELAALRRTLRGPAVSVAAG